MFRTFLTVPGQLLEAEVWQPSRYLDAGILGLPSQLIDIILDELDVLDRCAFALTCRKVLTYAHKNEHLDYIISMPPNEGRLQHFFEVQLGRGWIPPDLAYCADCGRFVCTDEIHWRYVSERYTREHAGRISSSWRERREEGWLKYWIDRWCGTLDVNAQALAQTDTTRLVCPRCAILNPDSNAWRQSRLEARNERHRDKPSRLLSPGLLSPIQARQRSLPQGNFF